MTTSTRPGGWEATATAPLDPACLRDGDEMYRFPANRYTEGGCTIAAYPCGQREPPSRSSYLDGDRFTLIVDSPPTPNLSPEAAKDGQ